MQVRLEVWTHAFNLTLSLQGQHGGGFKTLETTVAASHHFGSFRRDDLGVKLPCSDASGKILSFTLQRYLWLGRARLDLILHAMPDGYRLRSPGCTLNP